MWEIDANGSGKFPVIVGAFTASGSVDVTGSTTSTGVAGSDQHTLTELEIPEHNHTVTLDRQDCAGGNQQNTVYDGTDNGATEDGVVRDTDVAGGGQPHNNLPPFYGVYIIKRTARYFFTP
jgi:microcystin-dependent protein